LNTFELRGLIEFIVAKMKHTLALTYLSFKLAPYYYYTHLLNSGLSGFDTLSLM
jgi:hypothetical protein